MSRSGGRTRGEEQDSTIHPGLKLWLAWATWLERWHRVEVEGIEVLDRPDPVMIVGYHGRAAAHDLIVLNKLLYERHGRLPVSVVHKRFDQFPLLKVVKEGIGAVVGDGPELERELARGRHLIVTPGGARESTRPWREQYQVDWGPRTGYLRLALKHHLNIVPTAASGVDEVYVGLNDGYELGKRLRLPHGGTCWLAFGPFGPPQLLTPGFPVKIRQLIGEPIDLEADGEVDPEDSDKLLELHTMVRSRVQALLDQAIDNAGMTGDADSPGKTPNGAS